MEAQSLLSKPVTEEIGRAGITALTEIQEKALPLILNGANVLLIAPTGAGKTEAAIIPIFEAFIRLRSGGDRLEGISILYLTPLRSLNRDIFRRLSKVGERLGIKIDVRHGDTPPSARQLQSRKPPNMLITTPETFQAVLGGRRMREHLRGVRWVVVDELHELATDKRGAQMSLALERLEAFIGRSPLRIGLSATIGNPEAVGKFLVGVGRGVEVVKADGVRRIEALVESPTPKALNGEGAERLAIPHGTMARIRRMTELSEGNRTTLIFTNTREHAESLASKMKILNPNLALGIHHGSLSKDVRIEAERQMKEGGFRIVVATSSLELGIDVGVIDFVIQYLSPKQATRLLQRLGRSGHTIGGVAKGRIIASWPDDILESAVILRRALKEELEQPPLHHHALDALAHQLVGLTLDRGAITLEDAYRIVTRAHLYSDLSVEELGQVLTQLKEAGKLWVYEDHVRSSRMESRRYYYENLSMIPDVKQYVVFDFLSRKKIGVLDQEFVARHGKPGNQFILHGRVWSMVGVDEERYVVEVEEVEPTPAAIPGWEGETIPVPFEVAREVGEIRRRIVERLEAGGDSKEVLSGYPMDPPSRSKVVRTVEKQLGEGLPVPTDNQILVEGWENYIILHVCLGDKANQTLSRALASLLTARTGVEVALQSDPYRIALITPHPIDPALVERELRGLREGDVWKILDATLDQTTLFTWRMWHVARRFGVISREAEYKLTRARALLNALKGSAIYREALREIALENLEPQPVEDLLARMRAGEVRVHSEYRGEPSPFAIPLLDKIAPQDLLRPVENRQELLGLVKERLQKRTVKLLCAFKGDWEGVYTIRSLTPKMLRCPRCGSTLLASTHPAEADALALVKKRLRGGKLTAEEEWRWEGLWKSASLVQNYGLKAITALSARGIGPTTAVRVLRRARLGDEDALYNAILQAERTYLRTRMFWD